ncbi:hypothetical protein V6C03_07560 [Methyloligella sp. 2.7D]|uniref:hypothetical protein n=1 Tax=unclassified Methyloligella TaxID=2625955 RepID=UPI00157D1EC8|nr:hypothetical protein [Methyloligella sp. GL2]QKP78265.1 hypothetical protein HT051_12885 [Methyloligella sp. GL2]
MSEETEELFAAVGRAISEWAFVESALARLFSLSVHSSHPSAAEAAFYSATSFRTKLELLTSALAISSPNSTHCWKALCRKLTKRSKKRNHLAHFHFLIRSDDKGCSVRLAPPMGNPSNEIEIFDDNHCYSVEDIETARSEFVRAKNEVDEFRQSLGNSKQ